MKAVCDAIKALPVSPKSFPDSPATAHGLIPMSDMQIIRRLTAGNFGEVFVLFCLFCFFSFFCKDHFLNLTNLHLVEMSFSWTDISWKVEGC
jgi:hypothetical protein